MSIFSNIQDWKDYYYKIKRVMLGKMESGVRLDPLSPISFPVVIKDIEPKPIGAMAFFTKGARCSIESPAKFNIETDNFHLGRFSDILLFVEPCIKRLLDRHYPRSPRFSFF